MSFNYRRKPIEIIKNTLVSNLHVKDQTKNYLLNTINNLFENDLHVDRLLTIKPTQTRGFGIFCLEEVSKNTEIIKLSTTDTINGLHINGISEEDNKILKNQVFKSLKVLYPHKLNLKQKFQFDELYQQILLSYQIYINKLTKTSKFHDFVHSFPSSITNINLISRKIFDYINSRSLKQFIGDINMQIFKIHEKLTEDKFINISFEDFIWCYCSALSRKINVTNYNEVIQTLPPLFDLINHDYIPNCSVHSLWIPEYKKSYLILRSLTDLKIGDEILINYANYLGQDNVISNLELARKYGFVVNEKQTIIHGREFLFTCSDEKLRRVYFEDIEDNQGNKFTNVSYLNKIMNCNIFEKRKLFSDRIRSLNEKGKNQNYDDYLNYTLTLYADKFDKEFIVFLQVALLDESELEIENPRVDYKVFSYLDKIISYYLSPLKQERSNNYQNKAFTINSIENYYKNMIDILEHEERMILAKNSDYIRKKLDTLKI